MKNTELKDFLGKISRYEFEVAPIEYSKAIRVCLISLGYDEEWVNDEFRTQLEEYYNSFFEDIRL